MDNLNFQWRYNFSFSKSTLAKTQLDKVARNEDAIERASERPFDLASALMTLERVYEVMPPAYSTASSPAGPSTSMSLTSQLFRETRNPHLVVIVVDNGGRSWSSCAVPSTLCGFDNSIPFICRRCLAASSPLLSCARKDL